MREIPLEEIAPLLNLEPDRHDKHKWRGEGLIISINDQKFYDHLALKGGYGAIDLVMQVKGRSFSDSLKWLSNGTSYIPPPLERTPQQRTPPQERPPFQPPEPDELKWARVRQYLVEKRGLPESMVDELHRIGAIYADAKQNAVFVRKNSSGELTGASLRGTYLGSNFKGLATGSRRDEGYFAFSQGEGKLERIVLVESPIDAMSAAALAQKNGKTLFLSTDGAGATPMNLLRQKLEEGVKVIVAHDADNFGEQMAWELALALPSVSRATPASGKDWNEQLLSERSSNKTAATPDISEWSQVASALGKSKAYLQRVEAVTSAFKAGEPLSDKASAAMQQDFVAYKETQSALWQWHHAAKSLLRPDSYLRRIAEVAIAFNAAKEPSPLSEKAITAMQQDFQQVKQLLTLQTKQPGQELE